MWTNPNHPRPPRQAPPVEAGQRLAIFSRGRGVELRVNLATYLGHEYISIRVWEQSRGEWWPTRKGVSIRLCEVGGLLEALGRYEMGLAPTEEPARGDRR